jgi:signal transduction histidine kinase
MKIRRRLILLTSSLVILTIGFTSFLTVKYVEVTTIGHELEAMQSNISEKASILHSLHQRASEDIVFALRNPLFGRYFALPETKSGNTYEDGVLQFTDRQRSVKNQLEKWIYHFQQKFTIDETCLIDVYGQEHSRLVSRRIEPDKLLSDQEQSAPFFQPSMALKKDEVHVQSPYLSPDTQRWVFAYTSPVVLAGGVTPAFFHFEMPVEIFQELLKTDHGRMYVVDQQGFLIADSQTTYPNPKEASTYAEYFPAIEQAFPVGNHAPLLEEMRHSETGSASYRHAGNIQHVAFRKLQIFDWILVYEVPEAIMLGGGDFSVYDMQLSVSVITLLVILGALVSVFYISKRITDPVIELGYMTKKLSRGELDSKIVVKGDDEIHDLAESFNSMAESLKRTIELEKKLAVTEQNVKNEKLATIGSLSARIAHDIRNPLSVIRTAVELLQSSMAGNNPKANAQFVRLERAVDAMTFQVNSVLDFVRTRPLHMEVCSSKEIMAFCLDEVLIPSGVSVEVPEKDYELYCDREKISGVISNLILNAIQAMGGGGEITIRILPQSSSMVLEVEDSGPGVPEEVAPRIFDVVFTTKDDGTGLGLFSCKAAVEQHGGSIHMHNNPTTFVIELPTQSSAVPCADRGAEDII